ncbi:VOC family protein [Meiothermus sp.]|uniref:VOC family protein n=1 Tax=Meiothermus sp. TaxID=1955249 RepID=UPI00307D570D
MTRLDHLVLAAQTLQEGVEYVQDTLEVVLPPAGGRHPLMGTHNRLLNLGGGVYLEIIAIDPGAPTPARPCWFALDGFAGAPRLLTWVARTEALERYAALELGPVSKASRGDLEWYITLPEDGRLHWGGVVPYLIQWGPKHPTDTLSDLGCRLVELMVFHPRPEPGTLLQKLGLDIRLEPSDLPGLRAFIQTQSRLKVLR